MKTLLRTSRKLLDILDSVALFVASATVIIERLADAVGSAGSAIHRAALDLHIRLNQQRATRAYNAVKAAEDSIAAARRNLSVTRAQADEVQIDASRAIDAAISEKVVLGL